MALVVDLARDRQLLDTLSSIARSPRRILERFRARTRLDRIQQLDAACIRDYARQPGRTAAEKAGPRQELLAVQRRESMDTIENRVTCWVLEEVAALAREYAHANRRYAGSERVRSVERLLRRARGWRACDAFATVRPERIVHPVQPNYALLFNERYRRVHRTYQRIRRELRVLADAWEWQRLLWSETCRQLLACALTDGFQQTRSSTPYYRNEGARGFWTEPPVAPGPFDTPWGPCYLFDARDFGGWEDLAAVASLWPAAEHVGSVGCDQALWWPERHLAVLVWHCHWSGQAAECPALLARCGEAMDTLAHDLRRWQGLRMELRGLLLLSDLDTDASAEGVDVELWPETGAPTQAVALRIPPDVHRFRDDLYAGIELAVHSAAERQ